MVLHRNRTVEFHSDVFRVVLLVHADVDKMMVVEPLVDNDARYDRTDWQEKDLRYLSPMPYSANWSQMGCFKTSTGLWLMEKKQIKNALIVTSKVGKGPYFSDFYKCLPESWELYNVTPDPQVCTRVINDFTKEYALDEILMTIASGKHNYPMVLLAHYDVFTDRANKPTQKQLEKNTNWKGVLDKLKKLPMDMALLDEAHRMKNRKGQWVRNLKKLKFANKHLMTGTGFVNSPDEIWSLLNFLAPREFSSYWEFRNYFCDQWVDARGFRHVKGILPYRVEEFRKLRQRLGPRHTMATVHKGIKKPLETHRTVELNPAQRKMYNEIKSVLQTMDQKGEVLTSPNVLSQLNRLRQISVATPQVMSHQFDQKQNRMVYEIRLVEPSSKLDEVMEIMKEIDEPEQKVVIFSAFKDPLMMLETRFDKAGIGYLHMQQKHSEAQRFDMWSRQFRLPQHKVFLSTLALGGESINLSCAQYLIFLDRSWSPKDMMQAIGRVYRPGQTGVTEVIYIDAAKTVDSYVKKKLDKKEDWFNEIFRD